MRRTRLLGQPLAAWVLALFVLSLGVMLASSVVHPVRVEQVCSGATKLLIESDDGWVVQNPHTAHCPLCLLAGAPPSQVHALAVFAPPLSFAMPSMAGSPVAAMISAAPMPARGPPVLA
jgi:hypothetical protein